MGQSLVELLRKRDALLENIAAAEAGVAKHKLSGQQLQQLREEADRLSRDLADLEPLERRGQQEGMLLPPPPIPS